MKSLAASKRLYIKTYGCQMNVYDSERMAELLAPMGYVLTPLPQDAELVVLNTCHIREKASEKVFSELGQLRAIKQRKKACGGEMVIAVAGCVAQAEGAEIMRRQPAVDFVVGPQAYHELPGLLARRDRERVAARFAPKAKFDVLGCEREANAVSAFLTVQEGCDKFCTFCVVPYTRGPEYSRPSAQIVAEARSLADRGARQITLLGQNVNAYESDVDLAGLIRRLAEIPGLDRIRYTTSHPRDMGAALIEAHRDVERLMPYIHLPVQSGSDKILRRMNRGHTRSDYLRLVDRIRQAKPDIALSSDFIVGFPGETEADFQATLWLVEQVGFASAFSFKYSRRIGTPAAAIERQVEDEVKAERLARLQTVLEAQQRAFNSESIGKTASVLFEKTGRVGAQIVGRTAWLQAVHCTGDPKVIGTIRPVEITAARGSSLTGVLGQAA